jgi:hypothetical protein
MDRLIALMQRREISDSDLVVFDAKDVVRAGFALGYLWAQVIASQKASDFVVGKKTRKANTENSRRERERAKKPMENDPIVRGLKGIGWTPATPGRTSDSAVALRVRQWLEDNSRHPLPADRTIRKRIADLRRNPASLT